MIYAIFLGKSSTGNDAIKECPCFIIFFQLLGNAAKAQHLSQMRQEKNYIIKSEQFKLCLQFSSSLHYNEKLYILYVADRLIIRVVYFLIIS